jgi:hypothetical protein
MIDAAKKTLAKPVDWDDLYPGRFLKAADLKGKRVTVRIADVHLEELIGDKGPQVKGLLTFEGKDKAMALNKTNGMLIKAMFGRKLADWVGKRITLFEDTWDGDPCLRVWGSPDIAADLEVTVSLPRKRPFSRTMRRVDTATASAKKPAIRSISDASAEPPDDYIDNAREPGEEG